MKAIQIISQDLFDKVRSRFSNLEMGDETGAVTIDPAEARFFDFDFVVEDFDLGRVSISLADLGSLKIYYSQGITENQDDSAKKFWYDFLKEMRQFAKRRLLRFDTRDIAKTNLDKNDFQHLATTQPPKEQDMTTVAESRWTDKSTKKTSRAVKGRTQVVVRHTQSMEDVHASLRSHPKNIKAIFIENSDGERFKYPFIHLEGAFAMAQHVEHGGIPHDPAGKAIIRMSEQIAQLKEFQRSVQRTQLHDDAMGITERAVGRLQELKSQVRALGKRHYYESWISTFDESQYNDLQELDPVTMEEYKQKFTQTSFHDELTNLFPLIHSIMQEKVDLEDYVGEELKGNQKELDTDDDNDIDDTDLANLRKHKAAGESIENFEEWATALEEGTITPDQLQALKTELEGLAQSGQKLDFSTAQEFFENFGINDPQLAQDFKAQAELDPSENPLKTFKDWAAESYPDLLAPLSSVLPKDEPAVENDDSQWTNNVMSNLSEDNMSEIYHRVAEMIKSRYNQDNPNVGPFNGQEGILLDVEKEIKEKYGEEVGQHARQVAEKFMERLTQNWAAKHKPAVMGEKDNEGTPHSHQAQTTLKHLKNKTYGDRADAANIKPGVKGFKDRYDMLQRAKDTGNLKGDGDVEEAKYQKVSAQQKFKNSMKRAGYDMDAGAKRLQDLLDKQKKEREEKEKKDMAEGDSGAKYKVKSIGKDSKGDYYMSPSTGKKVYKSGVNKGDHENPKTGEIKKGVAEGAKWRKHPDAYNVDDEGNKTPRNPNSPKFGYDPLQRRADTANDAKTSRGKTAALKTSLKMAQGNKGVAEGLDPALDQQLTQLARNPDFDAIYDALGRNDALGARLQDMADDIARDYRLHMDDDIERIIDILADRLENDYGEGVAEERTEVKDKEGKVVSWRDEGEWKKVPTKKDPRGKVTNLSDKARRETEKMNPVKEEMDRILELCGVKK